MIPAGIIHQSPALPCPDNQSATGGGAGKDALAPEVGIDCRSSEGLKELLADRFSIPL